MTLLSCSQFPSRRTGCKIENPVDFFFPCSIFSAQVYSHRAVPAATPGQQQQEQAACDGTGGTADFPHQLQIKATFCVG